MHFMIDLETLSTRADATIVQIGVVAFIPKKGISGYTMWGVEPTGTIDVETVRWWFEKISEGTPSPFAGKEHYPEKEALSALGGFIDERSNGGHVEIWSKPGTFDIPILQEAFHRNGIVQPWTHRQTRCLKTLATLLPDVKEPEQEREHDALTDTRHQAWYACMLLEYLDDLLSTR